jgi:hypothetical protein
MKKMNIIYLFFISSFFLVLSLFAWDYVDVGLQHQNDFFRFYLFIFLAFFFIYFLLKKFKLLDYNFSEIVNLSSSSANKDNYLSSLYLFLLIYIFFIFFSFDSINLISLDIYHDGFHLTPSMNYILTDKLWSGSFVEAGFFSNYKSLLYFFFEERITIGSTILIEYVLVFLNKLALISLAFIITKELYFSRLSKITFLIIFSLGLFYITDSSSSTSYFLSRHFLFLIFVILIFFNLNLSTKVGLIINSILLGVVSFISLFWWVDIFIFNSLLLFAYLFFVYKRAEINKFIYICFGFLLSLLIALYFFPKNEIIFFLENIYYIIAKANKFTSVMYPSPLFGEDGRATKTLVLFFYSLFLFMLLLFRRTNDLSPTLRKFLIFLFLSSIISFLYGLGRSDSYHIIQSTGLLMFNLIFYHLFFIFSFFKQKNYKIKNIFLFPIIIVFLSFFIIIEYKNNSIKNISSFKKNISNFLLLDDNDFLLGKNSDYLKLITYYNNLLEKKECVQVLTDETIIPYIVKRQTCTRFLFYHILVDKKIQLKFIADLKLNKPRFVLYKSDLIPFNFFTELELVNNFIKKNYKFYEKFDHWTFYELK